MPTRSRLTLVNVLLLMASALILRGDQEPSLQLPGTPVTVPPFSVSAGVDQTIVLPPTGPATTTVEAFAYGQVSSGLTKRWTQIEGPAPAGIATPDALQTGLTLPTAGKYVLRATVTDRPPVAHILSPAPGLTLRKNFIITANATDDVGVAKMELYIDATRVLTTTGATLTGSFNPTPKSVGSGPHRIMVIAYDTAGLRGAEAIFFSK